MNKRIQSELLKYEDMEDLCFSIDVDDNDVNKLRASIYPPEGTPYEEGVFFVDITISPSYPSVAPKLAFVTPIYHPNIDSNGKICMKDFEDDWDSSKSLKDAIDYIVFMMENPNFDMPLVPEIAEVYNKSPEDFDKKAREYTQEHAQ